MQNNDSNHNSQLELVKLLEDNDRLAEQVKRMVQTEKDLYALKRQLDDQIRVYKQLYEIGKNFQSTFDVKTILDLATNHIVYNLTFERSAAFLKIADDTYLLQSHEGYYFDQEDLLNESKQWVDAQLIQRFSQDECYACTEVDQSGYNDKYRQAFQVNEFYLLPIGGEPTHPLGFILAGNSKQKAPYQTRVSKDSVHQLSIANFNSQVTISINNSFFYKELEKERALLEKKVASRTQELQQANEELREVDRIKTQFFANISHELRTPLTLSIGPAEILSHEESLDENARLHVKTIHNNQLRLLRLIDELLDFSKLEAGKEELSFRQYNIKELLKYQISTVISAATSKGINVESLLGDVDSYLYIDVKKFEKIIMNLLSNAIKFTPEGGHIVIKLVETNDQMLLSVEDSGIGISEEDIHYIFDRFHQLDASERRLYSGTGIGLSLVKEYMLLHQGDVSVKSKINEGTTFTLSFNKGKEHLDPRAIIEEEVDAPFEVKAYYKAEPHSEVLLKNLIEEDNVKRITDACVRRDTFDEVEYCIDTLEHIRSRVLVVDDTDDMRYYLQSILKDEHDIYLANNGLSALGIIRKIQPDLVISDVMMPTLSGYELCKHLKLNQSVYGVFPVLLLTAKSETDMIVEGLSCGANDYIVKPFKLEEFKARVNNLLIAHHQQRALARANRNNALQSEELKKTVKKLKKSQRKLKKQKKIAKQERNAAILASEFKSQFLAQMTHDLRTPLHVINGVLDLLSHDDRILVDGDLNQKTNIALNSAEQFLQLINSILDLSKIEAGKMDFNFHPFKLCDLLRGFEDQMNTIIKNKTVTFVVEDGTPNDLMLTADQMKLQQVITNLLSNAAKFTESGCIRLVVNKPDLPSPRMVFKVIDTGIGLSKENADKVFDSYTMIDSQLQQKNVGTGLGLSICKGFVEGHGGEISVISQEGVGSEFSFWIPYVKGNVESLNHNEPKQVDVDFLKNKRIVIIDDNQFNLFFVEMLFKNYLHCLTFENAEDALSLLETEEVDLIMTDLEMPGVDGRDFLESFRVFNQTTPVIVTTACVMKGTKEKMLEYGFTDYFPKPFKKSEVLNYIEDTLKQYVKQG